MVVEKMNGKIKCDSTENQGTLISFFITVEASHDDEGIS